MGRPPHPPGRERGEAAAGGGRRRGGNPTPPFRPLQGPYGADRGGGPRSAPPERQVRAVNPPGDPRSHPRKEGQRPALPKAHSPPSPGAGIPWPLGGPHPRRPPEAPPPRGGRAPKACSPRSPGARITWRQRGRAPPSKAPSLRSPGIQITRSSGRGPPSPLWIWAPGRSRRGPLTPLTWRRDHETLRGQSHPGKASQPEALHPPHPAPRSRDPPGRPVALPSGGPPGMGHVLRAPGEGIKGP